MTIGFLGLDINTDPTSSKIIEPSNSLYSRALIDTSTWNTVGGMLVNPVPIAFNLSDTPANIYIIASKFVFYTLFGNNIININTINPPGYYTQYASLIFEPGNLAIKTSANASTSGFPSIIYPSFSPTYLPAALGEPILYLRNMRS